jgi:hypothetical protein
MKPETIRPPYVSVWAIKKLAKVIETSDALDTASSMHDLARLMQPLWQFAGHDYASRAVYLKHLLLETTGRWRGWTKLSSWFNHFLLARRQIDSTPVGMVTAQDKWEDGMSFESAQNVLLSWNQLMANTIFSVCQFTLADASCDVFVPKSTMRHDIIAQLGHDLSRNYVVLRRAENVDLTNSALKSVSFDTAVPLVADLDLLRSRPGYRIVGRAYATELGNVNLECQVEISDVLIV